MHAPLKIHAHTSNMHAVNFLLSRMKNIKGFNKSWIDGTGSVKKDSLEEHLSCEPHNYAKSLSTKKSLGSA